MSEHTPTPWRLHERRVDDGFYDRYAILDEYADAIAWSENKEDGELIVKAVNEYDSLHAQVTDYENVHAKQAEMIEAIRAQVFFLRSEVERYKKALETIAEGFADEAGTYIATKALLAQEGEGK